MHGCWRAEEGGRATTGTCRQGGERPGPARRQGTGGDLHSRRTPSLPGERLRDLENPAPARGHGRAMDGQANLVDRAYSQVCTANFPNLDRLLIGGNRMGTSVDSQCNKGCWAIHAF